MVENSIEALVVLECDKLLVGDGGSTLGPHTIIFEQPKRKRAAGAERRGKILLVAPRGDPKVEDFLSKYGPCSSDDSSSSTSGPSAERPIVHYHKVPCVMPGMWDCHTHFFGVRDLDLAAQGLQQSPVAIGARAAADAFEALSAGFTSVREVAGNGLSLREAVEDGDVPGPHIYAAGAPLSITCGHGDLHHLPEDLACRALATIFGPHNICDGPWECVKSVRAQLRRGADVIKVMASGGVISLRDDPHHQEFSDEELSAIVKEAASKDRIVAAHCHGRAGIEAALKAGVGTIEHGTYLDKDLCQKMIDQGAILVPTILIQQQIATQGGEKGKFAPEMLSKIVEVAENHKRAFRLAVEMGVPIALGTDILTSGADSINPWGTHAKELQHMVDGGMRPAAALHAATGMGPRTLGPKRAPASGLVREGFDADLLALGGDPEEDVGRLQDRSFIWGVFKDGRLAVDRGMGGCRK